MAKRKKHAWQVELEKKQAQLKAGPKIPEQVKLPRLNESSEKSIDERIQRMLGMDPLVGFSFTGRRASSAELAMHYLTMDGQARSIRPNYE